MSYRNLISFLGPLLQYHVDTICGEKFGEVKSIQNKGHTDTHFKSVKDQDSLLRQTEVALILKHICQQCR